MHIPVRVCEHCGAIHKDLKSTSCNDCWNKLCDEIAERSPKQYVIKEPYLITGERDIDEVWWK